MTDRDRLIQDLLPITDHYLNTSEDKHFTPNTTIADVADLLIEKGWIRPPCKVGDTVYCIDNIMGMETLKLKPIIIPRVISEVKLNYTIMSNGMLLFESRFGHSIFHDVNKAEEKLKGLGK